MRYFLVLLILFFLPLTSINADNGLIDTVTVIKKYFGEYTNYCGHDNWKKAGWSSEKSCLTDGRVHLVYGHDTEGKPATFPENRHAESKKIQFTDTDKQRLFDAIEAGATISVREDNHVVTCVEASITAHKDGKNIPEAVCSSTDRIFAEWSIGTKKLKDAPNNRKRFPINNADAEYNRYVTSGHREFHHIHLNSDWPKHSDSEWDAYQRSRIIIQKSLRWYVRY
ncbi:MAG: hypothetical protein R3F02_02725 [Thiolinea sp.]